MHKTVYTYDSNGYFQGEDIALESPLERGTGIFMIPANATDVEPPRLLDGLVNRWNGTEWIPTPAPDSRARARRDMLLRSSDWTQLGDAPSSIDMAAWRAYRQQLRDLPSSDGWPHRVSWPVEPR